MGKIYTKLQAQSTDKASAQLALARFLTSEISEELPDLDSNRAFLTREEFDDRFGNYLEDEREELAEYPDENPYWTTKYEDDVAEVKEVTEAFCTERVSVLADLQRFADEWGIAFDARFVVQAAILAKSAHEAWASSWCN